MNTLYSILVAIDVLLAIGIIGLILIQHGKGADVGAAFGSGASGSVFGSQGSASFLTRVTAILATLFFINSLSLAYLASNRPIAESVIDTVEQTDINTKATDVPKIESMSDGETSDIPSIDDVPSSEMPVEEMGSEDMPTEIETQTDAAMSKAQDSMDSIKEDVESALDNVSPDDVPE